MDQPHDVVLSYAKEDKSTSDLIADALRNCNLTVYDFQNKHQQGEDWGDNVRRLTDELYGAERNLIKRCIDLLLGRGKSYFGICLISKHYNRKTWTQEELDLLLKNSRKSRPPKILPLVLEDFETSNLPKNLIFKRWNYADIIDEGQNLAQIVLRKVTEEKGKRRNRRRSIRLFSIVTITIIIVFSLSWLNQNDIKGPGSKPIPPITLQVGTTKTKTIQVKKGNTVTIKARGSIKLGNWVGTAGPDGKESGVGGIPIDNYSIFKNFNHGALLIKLPNESDWHFCGSEYEFVAQEDGPFDIQFDINDHKKSDNQGEFDVTIKIQ